MIWTAERRGSTTAAPRRTAIGTAQAADTGRPERTAVDADRAVHRTDR